MKKVLLLCLAALLCLSLLTACTEPGTGESTQTDTEPSVPTDVPTDVPTEPVTEAKTDPAPIIAVPAVRPTPADMSTAAGTDAPSVSCASVSLGSGAADYADELTALGFAVAEGGLPLSVTVADMTAEFASCPDEGYVLTVTPDGADVRAGSDRGVFYALLTLAQLRCDDALPVVTVRDAPTMPIRGVIEGFYGVAWTHEFRLELFEFMGKYKMNTYMYAPKDDPKHRAQWRSTYTGAELERMQALIDTAAANRVRFVYAISPGLDFDLGSGYDRDFAALCKKCESMYGLGVRDFAILLDDIPTLDADGHARLLNDFQTQFVRTHEGMSDLIAITPEFCDAMLTGYTDKLAPQLDPDIELMWTGEGVIPASITTRTLSKIQKKYDRKVLIWWNYPVNDGQPNNLFMDAARGLAGDLDKSVTGLLSNPMNQGHASMTPLFTIADYLWNPAAYKPDESLNAAVRTLYPDVADALLALIDLTGASPMNGQTESKTISRLVDAFKKDPNKDNTTALYDAIVKLYDGANLLRSKGDPALLAEIGPWLDKMYAYAVMGMRYCELERMAANGDTNRYSMMDLLSPYVMARDTTLQNGAIVSPGTLTPWLAGLAPRINQMFGFEGGASAPGLSTNLPTYENYVLANAQNNDPNAWFWSAGAPDANSYIQINLGQVQHVDRIILKSGVGGHNDDYIHSGELVYSTDGKTWKSLCKVTTPTLDMEVDITAQYIRLKCLSSQQFWVTVSEFAAWADDGTNDITTDLPFVSDMQLLSLVDQNLLVGLTTDASAKGHTLTIPTNGCDRMIIYFTSPAEKPDMEMRLVKADGTSTITFPKKYEFIHFSEYYDKVVITFGDVPVTIAEIERISD